MVCGVCVCMCIVLCVVCFVCGVFCMLCVLYVGVCVWCVLCVCGVCVMCVFFCVCVMCVVWCVVCVVCVCCVCCLWCVCCVLCAVCCMWGVWGVWCGCVGCVCGVCAVCGVCGMCCVLCAVCCMWGVWGVVSVLRSHGSPWPQTACSDPPSGSTLLEFRGSGRVPARGSGGLSLGPGPRPGGGPCWGLSFSSPLFLSFTPLCRRALTSTNCSPFTHVPAHLTLDPGNTSFLVSETQYPPDPREGVPSGCHFLRGDREPRNVACPILSPLTVSP